MSINGYSFGIDLEESIDRIEDWKFVLFHSSRVSNNRSELLARSEERSQMMILSNRFLADGNGQCRVLQRFEFHAVSSNEFIFTRGLDDVVVIHAYTLHSMRSVSKFDCSCCCWTSGFYVLTEPARASLVVTFLVIAITGSVELLIALLADDELVIMVVLLLKVPKIF